MPTEEKGKQGAYTSEDLGRDFARDLTRHFADRNGRYLRDENGGLHVILEGRRISLECRDDNHPLVNLMIEVCDVSTLSQAAKAAIQRIRGEAYVKAGKMRFRKFSAMSNDGERLYIPVDDGNLLRIADGEAKVVPNGDNEDELWIEHPFSAPLKYSEDHDVQQGLADFERLLVDTQACSDPSMRWFVAMNAGFFPFIRDVCPARMIQQSMGPSQSGKTSGATRFTLLHGLGDVQIDTTVATLGNLGDIGLLVLDNKEQANFTQPLIDFCLRLATGGERGRSHSDGRVREQGQGRPVAVITTIEGVVKPELQARCVQVQYVVRGDRLTRSEIEREIKRSRDKIGSSMVQVLNLYQVNRDQAPVPNPVPTFEEHFRALCDLLRAFGALAAKPDEWSEEIIAQWDEVIRGTEDEEDDLEHPINRVLQEIVNTEDATYKGKTGKLYLTEAAELLTALQKLNIRDIQLPKNPNGLSRRLNSNRFQSFEFLKTDTPGLSGLKRTGTKRPIGFFKAR